ncbi:hypothetical protein JCM10135_03180 [Stetteria hydrogenophila]
MLLEERLIGYLDPGAEGVLRALNVEGVAETTSSCMGRVTVIEGEWPWERREETRIVLKSHTRLSPERVAMVMARPFDNLWLKASGPIIHFRVYSMECGEALLRAARAAGFKHSGAITLAGDPGCCVVEVSSPTEVAIPLKIRGRILVTGWALVEAVELANRALAEGRSRLAKLLSLAPEALRDCS